MIQSLPILGPTVTPRIEALLAKKAPPLYTLSYIEARKVLDEAQSGPVETPPVQIEERVLPCGPDKKVSVSINRKEKSVLSN